MLKPKTKKSRKACCFLLGAVILGFSLPVLAQVPEWVTEGIAQYDSQIHSFTVCFQRRITDYRSLKDLKPFEIPVLKTEQGTLIIDGRRKRYSLSHRGEIQFPPYDGSQTVEADILEERITDGERVVRLVTTDLGDGLKQTAEYLNPREDHFLVVSCFDPRTWMTAFGTPVGKFLSSPDISSISSEEVTVAGELCVRIRVERNQLGFSEFLINTQRGYRVQQVVREWMRGSRTFQTKTSVELTQDENEVWYPRRVRWHYLVDNEPVFEHLIEFAEFRANVTFPTGTFSTLAPEGAHIVGEMTGGNPQ